MRPSIRLVWVLLITICVSVSARAQEPAANTTAPVPAQIAAAKKIFISYAGTERPYSGDELFQDYSGDPNRAYYQFYAALKDLGRYELLPAPANADLIFEVGMRIQTVTGSKGTDNVYTLRVRILDPATHVALWGFERCIPTAITQKNRDKNFDQMLNGIVQDFVALSGRH